MTPTDVAGHIDHMLSTLAMPERAELDRRYLKSTLDHYGVSVPDVRATVKSAVREHPAPTAAEALAIAELLWTREIHECRMAAVEWLVSCVDRLRPDHLPVVESMLRSAGTWALVDPVATKIVAALYEGDPQTMGARLDRWAVDEDFWVRRAALLALLPSLRGGDGDFARFSRYADAMLDEREFFIRKAIGWVLRETGRTRPDEVAAWLEPRIERTSGVTLREAVKWLPRQRADALLTSRGLDDQTPRGRSSDHRS